MASESSHPGEEEGKLRMKRREREMRRKKVSVVDIEELTSAGHRALKDGQAEDALRCFKDALKTAEQLKDSRVLRVCSFNLGAAYVEAGRPQRGLDFLQKAEPGPKADRIPDLQFNLALAHNALGQSQEASTLFLQAAHLYRSQGAGGSEGDACMEMGRCYTRTQDGYAVCKTFGCTVAVKEANTSNFFTQDWSWAVQAFLRAAESYRVAAMLDSAATALKEAGIYMVQSEEFNCADITSVLTECLSLTDSIKDPRTLGELYLSVGVSYCRLRCFKDAVQCFQAALDPTAQCPTLLAKVLHNLGAALNSLGQFTSAVGYHQQAAGLYGSLGCRGDQARCFSNLGFAYSQLSEEEQAAESFIHALLGFRDTEDHLAQVQVCESLAECYLKQKKLQKAIQLYKEALSALSHCEDDVGQYRDRLVEHLTAALQQSLTVNLQRPHLLRPRPCRPHPHNSPVRLHVRKSDITQSPGRVTNQQLDQQKGEGPGDLWSDRENPLTDSEASLVQETNVQPTSRDNIIKIPSPMSQWRSRFCSLM